MTLDRLRLGRSMACRAHKTGGVRGDVVPRGRTVAWSQTKGPPVCSLLRADGRSVQRGGSQHGRAARSTGRHFGDLAKSLDDILKGLAGGKGATNWFGWFEDDPEPVPSQVCAIFDTASTVTRGGVKVPGGTGYPELPLSFKPIGRFRSTDDAIVVQATLNIDRHWEIASEGRGTSITSAGDPAITETSYLTIIHNLGSPSESYTAGGGVATTFWSEPLVERHELFHRKDYIGRAVNYLPTAQSWLETQQVTHAPNNDTGGKAQMQDLVGKTRQKVEDDGRASFNAGGGARAYGDGKGSHDALINRIKAKAKSKKWRGYGGTKPVNGGARHAVARQTDPGPIQPAAPATPSTSATAPNRNPAPSHRR